MFTREEIAELSVSLLPTINKFDENDFLTLINSLSSFGTHFENNLLLISKYLTGISIVSQKLRLEHILYTVFLKKYQKNDYYNSFFQMIQKNCQVKAQQKISRKVENSVWFYVNNPIFLAHTNALFSLLETRDNSNISVTIAAGVYSAAFQQKCEELGANFLVLEGCDLEEQYLWLTAKAKNAAALCIVGPPVGVNFISKHVENSVWWSHRFHPNFQYVRHHVAGGYLGEINYRFGQKWLGFRGNFDVKNTHKKSKWSTRKNNFGTFCREELIDNKIHWLRVKKILSANLESLYYYAGKLEIHPKWCEKLEIDTNRINYLGWLKEPDKHILQMMFLVDPPNLGHGLMGMEAMGGAIPILSHTKTDGFYPQFLKRIKFLSSEAQSLGMVKNTIFENEEDLITVVSMLMEKNFNESIGSILEKKFEDFEADASSFQEFISIIK